MTFKKQAFVKQAKSLKPTAEQVVNAEYVKQGLDVKVVAGAGTGKSGSLRYIAEQVPDKNILVLCFNKANADESNTHPEHPENIFYATINSIAYGKVVDAVYRKKLSFLSYKDLEDYAIESFCGLTYEETVVATKAIINGITAYCRSDKTSLEGVVQDYLFWNHSYGSSNPEITTNFSESVLDRLTRFAVLYWDKLVDKHSSASISHDVYLKLYQLAGHKIEEFYDKTTKRYVKVDILVIDEAQDTNPVSEAIFRNQTQLQRVVVGDPMQCVLKGTLIGNVPVEDINIGDYVQSAVAGHSLPRKVTDIKKGITSGIITIKTALGKKLSTTLYHTHFGIYPDKTTDIIVYLMYKKDMGYKIGITKDFRQRCKGEVADSIWILKNYKDDLQAARIYETVTSYNYKVPETIFKTTRRDNDGDLTQESLDTIYSSIDSTTGALRLLADLGLDIDFPHYQPVKYLTEQMNVTVTLNGNSSSLASPQHRYSVILPKEQAETFKSFFPKYNVRDTGKADGSKRVEGSTTNMEVCYNLFKDIQQIFPKARLKELANVASGKSLEFLPAINLVKGIQVLVEHNGILILDTITEVSRENGEFEVYDINIDRTHNFIANGVVTHNCIYAWRGAKDIMALSYYDDFTTGFLSESFRFNQGIANKANYVLGKAGSKLKLIGSGSKTECNTKAVLCRTNASVVETLLEFMTKQPTAKLYTSIDLKDTFAKLYHMEAAWFDSVPKYPCKELSHIVDKKSLIKAIEMSDDIARLHKLRSSLVGTSTITKVKKELEDRLVGRMEDADIVVSTIHRSKGLEFDSVIIADDFMAHSDKDTVEDIQERIWGSLVHLNMLYVGLTRARIQVKLPWYLGEINESEELSKFESAYY